MFDARRRASEGGSGARPWAALVLRAAALALVAFGLSCSSGSTGPCKDDYDCDGTEVCNSGKCVEVVCRQDKDCLDPLKVCQDNACVPKPQ